MRQRSLPLNEPLKEGIVVSNFIANITNIMSVVPLPAGTVSVDLTYENNSGNAGNIMVVPDSIGSVDAAARMARTDSHIQILPGETRSIKFNPQTRPSFLFIKSVSALSSGSNKFHIRENAEIILPTVATSFSSKLWAYWPCTQGTSDAFLGALNPSRNIAFYATLTPGAAWANPGTITLPAVTSAAQTYPTVDKDTFNAAFSWHTGDTIIFSFRTTCTVGVNLAMFGSGYSAVVNGAGFRIRADSSGYVSGACYAENGTIVYPAGASGRQSISTGEHHITFCLDGTAKVCRIAVDGAVESSAFDCSALDYLRTGSGLLIGGGSTSLGTLHTGPAEQMRDIHIYIAKTQSVGTTEFSTIANRCYTTFGPLLSTEWA